MSTTPPTTTTTTLPPVKESPLKGRINLVAQLKTKVDGIETRVDNIQKAMSKPAEAVVERGEIDDLKTKIDDLFVSKSNDDDNLGSLKNQLAVMKKDLAQLSTLKSEVAYLRKQVNEIDAIKREVADLQSAITSSSGGASASWLDNQLDALSRRYGNECWDNGRKLGFKDDELMDYIKNATDTFTAMRRLMQTWCENSSLVDKEKIAHLEMMCNSHSREGPKNQ